MTFSYEDFQGRVIDQMQQVKVLRHDGHLGKAQTKYCAMNDYFIQLIVSGQLSNPGQIRTVAAIFLTAIDWGGPYELPYRLGLEALERWSNYSLSHNVNSTIECGVRSAPQ